VHVQHFTYGVVTPILAYALSVLGSLAGLVATARARTVQDRGRRSRWLLLAAWAIGGTGIWAMHFMSMIGFSLAGVPVRYDIPVTLASWIIAVVVVAIGLFIVGFGRPNPAKILAAGVLTGIGVAAMHYTGMSAMRTSYAIAYDRDVVVASIGIAVVASTVALWFTVALRRGLALTIAALIMAVAVSGMHYTGMFAVHVADEVIAKRVDGLLPFSFIAPIVLSVVLVTVVLLASLLSRDADGDPTVRLREPSPAPPEADSSRQPTAASAFIRPSRG
jgi:NO-binding membrane sensor protein with MHYT domain